MQIQGIQRTDDPADQDDHNDIHGEKPGRHEGCQHDDDGQPSLLFEDGPGHIDDHVEDHRRYPRQHSGHGHAHIPIGAEGLVKSGDDGNDDQRRQGRTHHGDQRAGDPGHMVAHQNGGIDGDGAGAGLGNGGQVQHFLLLNPMQPFHKALAHQRNNYKAAAEGAGAELEGGEEQLPVFFSFVQWNQSPLKTAPRSAAQPQSLRDFVHSGQRIEEKALKSLAVVIGIVRDDPVTLTASPAQPYPFTGAARRRGFPAVGEKDAHCFAGEHGSEGIFPDRPKPVRIQAEEVARVDSAAALYHQIGPAGTGGRAGACRAAYEQMNVVFKQTDADIAAGFPIPIPFIKQAAQELTVQLRGEGIVLLSPGDIQRIQAGDELEIADSGFLHGPIGTGCLFRQPLGDNAQEVARDLVLIQQGQSLRNSFPGSPTAGIQPQRVVDGGNAVQADTNQKVFLPKERGPVLRNGKPVCLDGILDADVLLIVFPNGLREEPEEVQPRQGRFPALEGEGEAAARVKLREALADECLGCRKRHHAAVWTGAVFLFVSVEAVLAAHIAEAGGGLYQ